MVIRAENEEKLRREKIELLESEANRRMLELVDLKNRETRAKNIKD